MTKIVFLVMLDRHWREKGEGKKGVGSNYFGHIFALMQ
jgi:hypothetical protein